jgi:hypothetical protein
VATLVAVFRSSGPTALARAGEGQLGTGQEIVPRGGAGCGTAG